jgi:ABC-type polysaccharide/polyol phosphate export permease
MCSKSETGEVSYDKLSFNKNSDRCTLEFNLFHNAGCAVVKASGFLQYLNSYSLINGLILIAFGSFTCFYGGKHPRNVSFGLLALLIFLLFAIIFSYIGTLAVLEEDTETTWSNVTKAGVCFLTSVSIALLVSAYLNQWKIYV